MTDTVTTHQEGTTMTDKVTYDSAGETPARTLTQRTNGQTTLMMSEIGPGVFVGWDHCNSCAEGVADCECPGGPTEREFVTRWREERLAALDSRRVPVPARIAEPVEPAAEDSDTRQDLDTGLNNAKAALAARAAEIPVDF